MQKNLRQDLSMRIGLVIFTISIAIGSISYYFSVRASEKEFNNYIQNQTNGISNTFTLQLWFFDLNTTQDLCKLLIDSPAISGLRLTDHQGRVIFEQEPLSTEFTTHIAKELYYQGTKLVGYVDIYYSNTSWLRQRKNILVIGICMTLGTIVGSFLFINILLTRYLSNPLKDLQKDMELLSQGDFQRSDLVDQKDEIQNIIDTFNDLSSRLQMRDQEISQKTADLEKEITERIHTEKLLRASHEQWEKTFNAMDDIITIHDKEMRILQANKATFDFFHLNPEEVVGKHCYTLFRGTETPCANCPELSTIEDGIIHTEIITHDNLGKIFHVTSAPIMNQNGEFSHIVHIAKDITDQKRMEADLFQAHKMEAIGTLAGGIAHDFNNILTAILGYAELAMQRIPQELEPIRNHIEQVINAGDRAKELVKQILTFSRKSQETLQPIQPSLIIKEALKFVRSSLPTTIEIKEEIDSDCGFIIANPTNIHQVLVNLCTNSLHAMENEKGILTVRLQRVDLKPEAIPDAGTPAGPFVELMVRDTGCGMEPETLARIFEPYFTTKKVGQGTGMGLSLVHGIVKSCRGFIKVESEPGKGSTFHIYFPAIETRANQAEEEVDEEQGRLPTGNERILAIDDEEAIVDMYQETLENLGYKVSAHCSSTKGFEEFQASPDSFDLIITDQTMPGLAGSELAQKILRIRSDMPIIMSTGYSSQISKEKAEEIGIVMFLMKPVSRRNLAFTVRKVLDKNKS